MRRVVPVVWLTGLWVLLWRDLSPATVGAGLVVAVAVRALVPLGQGEHPERHRIRPFALIRFAGYFAWKLLEANVVLAREVLTHRDTTRPGIIAVRLHPASDLLVTVIANAVSLTPGTVTLETSTDPRTLYVHVLHLDDQRVRHDIRRLEELSRAAFGYDAPTEEVSG